MLYYIYIFGHFDIAKTWNGLKVVKQLPQERVTCQNPAVTAMQRGPC